MGEQGDHSKNNAAAGGRPEGESGRNSGGKTVDNAAADPAKGAGAGSEGSRPEENRVKFEGFGTFIGVYIPSILTILGVIMFLRLGWVVGQAGIWKTMGIITLATSITLITGFSISATATNMKVRGGGAYFMISRSFGIESGAAIGLPLYLAQATGVAFYLAGFAESVHQLLPQFSTQSVGLTALLFTTVLAFISANLALKSQLVIFGLIIVSLGSFIFGNALPASPSGLSLPPTVPFWVVFAVFFPAVTGIEAGLSMSGDLKNPSRSLPLGIISAIATGYVIYLGLAVLLWSQAPTATLRGNPMVMWDVALSPEAIYVGIWGATLSSAMGALLGGSRTLQALAQDGVVPRFLGRGYGAGKDPRIATLITFAIGAAGLMFGDLNLIAPVLSMFFLTSYGTLNLISALEGLIGNPSWRPTFRTPWRLSLLGAGVCLSTMLLIDPGASITAILACAGVYMLMRRRNMRSGWADIRGGLMRALARYSIYSLAEYQVAARTWRPNILLFSGAPTNRWHLVELADSISHGMGFLTIAVMLEQETLSEEKVGSLEKSLHDFLEKKRVPALVRVKPTGESGDLIAGMEGLITDYGLGGIEPNTVMVGASQDPQHLAGFCRLLKTTHFLQRNLLIVREQENALQPPQRSEDQRNIDIWFAQKSGNSTLMLVYAYMLCESPEWRGTSLTLKTLVEHEDGMRGVREFMENFIKASRIEAGLQVYLRQPGQTPLEEISGYSQAADVVFLGLRAPERDETPEMYSAYYLELLEATRQFPLTLITLAGQNLSFDDIFV